MVQAVSGRVPHAPPYSGFRSPASGFAYGALTPSGRPSDAVPLAFRNGLLRPYNPGPVAGLGFSGSARRYSRNRFCFLFLRVLRCFNSPGCTPWLMCSARGWHGSSPCRVSPFGYPRIVARLPLPVAFRRMPRPSSPPHAKTSAMRPSSFDLCFFLARELLTAFAHVNNLSFRLQLPERPICLSCRPVFKEPRAPSCARPRGDPRKTRQDSSSRRPSCAFLLRLSP